ncbi:MULTISPECIES: MFS transporter [Micrococcaceae]|uniref:Putative proline/betaine transporter n=1 Tax=Glutamicibacter soli TaxID=453836 RepID=A0A365YFB4_9MICC|nr:MULTISPECIES: MFS transporter [Micrococcaceae]ALD65212.1 MFS transporter [Arthrobacter sp. LS16]ALQ29377.1 MFS transporter [Arthrobacter sp. YC-RL1]KLI89233.1 MFS transporter [Arthrobacter sp. YC-RL1]NAZ16978.1 MFS transporter [Glutamicibacter soli]RBM01229.1 MFS transporter [Glutamicibacter soli]
MTEHDQSQGSQTRLLPAAPGAGTAQIDPGVRRKVVAASFIGNFVEWFDYAAYGYLAVTISAVFFPSEDRQLALMMTFGVFAISFLVRPLGGFIWGHLGDKIGRRTALSWSILLMTGATFCIALLPGYAAIGVAAPLMLLALRLVQGFSAAGEYAGASAFLVEYAPANKRGLYAAVVPASTATGLLLGSLMAAVLTGALSADQMESWGWRIPFLLAAPMGLIGRYIRTKLEDSPAFLEASEEPSQDSSPVRDLFRNHWRQLLQAAGAVLLNAVGFYVILSYMPTYLSEELGLDATRSYLATTVALATYIGFIFLTGMLSDKFGRKRVLISASILFIVFIVPAFMLLETGNFLVIVLVQILLGAMLTLNDGTLPSFLAEMFPTKVRYSGFAVSFNLSNALFGGTAPFVATLLIATSGNLLAPGWYLMGAAVISLVAVACSVETSRKPLS